MCQVDPGARSAAALGSGAAPDQPFLHQRSSQLIGESDDAGEIGGHGLIGVGPLGARRRAVETELRGSAGPDLDLPRERPRVAFQATVRDVEGEVARREAAARWICGDGSRGDLSPGPRRPGEGADESAATRAQRWRRPLGFGLPAPLDIRPQNREVTGPEPDCCPIWVPCGIYWYG
jgi:hypothetical protein